MIIVLSWWVLVASGHIGNPWDIPRALGPYPSAEFCRLAAHSAMPQARQFWTANERAIQRRNDEESALVASRLAAAQRQEIAAIPLATRRSRNGQPVTLSDRCTVVYFNGEGKQTGLGQQCVHAVNVINTYVEPTPLTDCVSIPETKTP